MKKMRWAGCLANIRTNREAVKTSVGKLEKKGHFGSTSSADERGVKPVNLPGPTVRKMSRGPGTDCIAYASVFLCSIIICRLHQPESLGT